MTLILIFFIYPNLSIYILTHWAKTIYCDSESEHKNEAKICSPEMSNRFICQIETRVILYTVGRSIQQLLLFMICQMSPVVHRGRKPVTSPLFLVLPLPLWLLVKVRLLLLHLNNPELFYWVAFKLSTLRILNHSTTTHVVAGVSTLSSKLAPYRS